jgi:hypothetical protein
LMDQLLLTNEQLWASVQLDQPPLTEIRLTNRNLRTRRIMHLCMQDDQIGPKIIGLAPADMARLPPSISPTNMFLVVYNLVCQWDYTYFELALLYKGNCPFFTRHSPSMYS